MTEIYSGKTLFFSDVHGGSVESYLHGLSPFGKVPVSDPQYDRHIFLGDAMNRGPQSARATQELRQMSQRSSLDWVMGNHDALFAAAAMGDDKSFRRLISTGGIQTLLSYGIDVAKILKMADSDNLDGVIPGSISKIQLQPHQGGPFPTYNSGMKARGQMLARLTNFPIEEELAKLQDAFVKNAQVINDANFIANNCKPYAISRGYLGVHAGIPINDDGSLRKMSMRDFMQGYPGDWSDEKLSGLYFLDELGKYFGNVSVLARIGLGKWNSACPGEAEDTDNPMGMRHSYFDSFGSVKNGEKNPIGMVSSNTDQSISNGDPRSGRQLTMVRELDEQAKRRGEGGISGVVHGHSKEPAKMNFGNIFFIDGNIYKGKPPIVFEAVQDAQGATNGYKKELK